MECALMKAARISIGVVAIIVAVLGVRPTAAQVDPRLPEGPNRDLVIRICGSCHDLSNLYSTVGRSREGWNETIDNMVLFGLSVTPQERALILDYLATYLRR
jgi:hypothetical protein